MYVARHKGDPDTLPARKKLELFYEPVTLFLRQSDATHKCKGEFEVEVFDLVITCSPMIILLSKLDEYQVIIMAMLVCLPDHLTILPPH